MKVTQFKARPNSKMQAGFTLIELMIVVIILGVLAAMAYSNYSTSATAPATAQQYYSVANQGTRAWSQMVAVSGAPRTITSNPVFEGGNSILDLLVAGDEVVADNYKNSYRRAGLAPSEDMVQAVTFPSAGTPGAYQLGPVVVTVVDGDETGYLNWVFTGVTPEVVSAVLDQHEPSITGYNLGDPISASDSRRFRAAEGTGGLMNLTIVTRVQ